MRISSSSLALLLACGCGPTAGGGGGEASTGEAETGGASESETGAPEHCGHVSLQQAFVPPLILFVVDRSESMLALWDHDGSPDTPPQTRWASAWQVVDKLTALWGGSAHLGLQLFPSADACPNATSMVPSCTDASACLVASPPEVELGPGNAEAILAVVPAPDADPVELAGASPATAAYASALTQVLEHPEFPERLAHLVLITDGRVNCGAGLDVPESFAAHDEQLRELVEVAFQEQGVYTVVVAVDEAADPNLDLGADTIPGFDPRPALQELGFAGGVSYPDLGTPYFGADRLEGIETAVEPYADDGFGCWIDLSMTSEGLPSPEQIDLVSWELGGEPIPYVEPEQCETETGWTWLVDDNTPIGVLVQFCGEACDSFEKGARVDGYYGCPE